MASNQTLPAKEQGLFKQIVKFYESKMYKKALKVADQVLKKHPNHGETLAMKGLTLNSLERKEEAYEYVRKGLKNDIRSHVCWHVYGLINRTDENYPEAIKCYRNALKWDKDNQQILRDLSQLQAQTRDWEGFVETRRILLTLKPSIRNNWVGYIIANHLAKDYDQAVDVIQKYEDTLADVPPENEHYEHSELLMFKAMVQQEAGKYEDALKTLYTRGKHIVDKLGLKEQMAALFLKLGRMSEAQIKYRELIDYNADNYEYYYKLQEAMGLSSNALTGKQLEDLKELYADLQKSHPKATAAKRLPLNFLSGDDFSAAFSAYINPLLRKGVPSLFSSVMHLYTSDETGDKIQRMEATILKTLASLQDYGTFTGTAATCEAEAESPSVVVWALLLLAYHYDQVSKPMDALATIEKAIEHTPTIIDLYSCKSQILTNGGDVASAAMVADEARRLDLADRFLNSEATKRLLRADRVEDAEKTITLFTKDGDNGNNLYDMQCMWYELEVGDSYLRQKVYGRALKKYHAISEHFDTFEDDQMDFHSYCLRKMTMRAYVGMLRLEERIRGHEFYRGAAEGAIKCYIALFDQPRQRNPQVAEEEMLAKMSKDERKKYRAKQRKAEAKAKAEADALAAKQKESENDDDKQAEKPKKKVDPDPEGHELVKSETPLKNAEKFIAALEGQAGSWMNTHLLRFEVAIRQLDQLPRALEAVKKGMEIDAADPDLLLCLVRLAQKVAASAGDLDEKIKADLDRGIAEILSGTDLKGFCSGYSAKHAKSSLRHCSASAEASVMVDGASKAAALKQLLGYTAADLVRWGLNACVEVHEKLLGAEGPLSDAAAASDWQKRCAEAFPLSVYFTGVGRDKLRVHGLLDANTNQPSSDELSATC